MKKSKNIMNIEKDDLEIIDSVYQRHLILLNATVVVLKTRINAVLQNRVKEQYQLRISEQKYLLERISIKHYGDSRLMLEFEGMIGIE